MNFEEDYPDATVIKLEQNYRSTKTILQKSLMKLSKITSIVKLKLYGRKTLTVKRSIIIVRIMPMMRPFMSLNRSSKKMRTEGKHYGDFAVLYRTNAQSRVIEETFVKANIPYKLVGAHRFYDRKEILDILAYLRLVANPNDSLSFARVANEPKRGIGATSLAKLQAFAEMNGLSLIEAN